MPRTRKPNPDSPELKHQILEAARACFAEEGIEAVSMRRIAQAAGCSATAIYLYFADREDLVQVLVLEDFRTLAQRLEELSRAVDPLVRIRQMAHAFANFAAQNPHHYRFLFMMPRPPVDPAISATRDRPEENAYLLLKTAVEEGVRTHRFRKDLESADGIAQTLLSGIHGVLAFHISAFRDPWLPWLPLEKRIDLMLETLIRGLL